MAIGAGYPFICGAGVESVWGTAVVMTDRIPVLKESLTDAIKMIEDASLRGFAGHDALDLGTIDVKGSLSTDLRYTQKSGTFFCGSDMLLSIAMGGAPVINSNVMTLFLAESPAKYITLAMDKKVSYWEFESCALNGFKIDMKVDEPVMLDFPVIAHRVLRAGTTNGATQFTNLAASGGKRVLFGDIRFRMDSIANGALTDADSIGIGECSLNYESALSESQYSSPDASVTVGGGVHGDNATTHSSLLTLPVVRNGRRKVTLEFTAPRYTTDTFITWRDAGTEVQLDAKSSIDSAARTFSLLIPRIKIESVEVNVDSAEIMPIKIKATCLYNGGTSSGGGVNAVMTNSVPSTNKIPEEFQIELKNTTDGRTAVIWS